MEDVIELCNRYLNSQMKSYAMGINIFQELSYDVDTEDAKMLPSYIYYGVSSKEAVIVSKIGVPRFALNSVLQVLKKEHPEIKIDVQNMENIKKVIRNIEPNKYNIENVSGEIVKKIVDSKME